MSVRTIILLIICTIFVTYSTSFLNGFVGDDHVLFVGNNFYKDFSNLPKLFSNDYIVKFTDIDIAYQFGERSFSAGVSYRPVTAFTIFISYFLWKDNPAGYHLDGILMHILITLFVFYLIFLIGKSKELALIGSLIFATHPINTEVVNIMSYRSDPVSLIFYLIAFISYVQYRGSPVSKKKLMLVVSLTAFFLALFSKENAVSLLFMIMAYDFLFSGESGREIFRKEKWVYLGFLAILIFYFYIYLFVFPNANSPTLIKVGENFSDRLFVGSKIVYYYLSLFIWPFKITVLPPLYAPPVSSVKIYELLFMITFIVVSVFLFVRYSKKNKGLAFGLIWFWVTYIPTAYILPAPNPFALRFLYLPVIGLCFILALAIEQAAVRLNRRLTLPNARWILLLIFVGVNMGMTFPQNMFYKNNITACEEMVRNYPDCSRPYWVLGLTYLNLGKDEKARKNFQKYLEISRNNPFVEAMGQDYFIHHLLGRTYTEDPDRAIIEYKIAMRLRPDYVHPFLDLSLAYIQKKDYPEAITSAKKVIERRENILAYICAIFSYMELDDLRNAREMLSQAFEHFPKDRYLKHYETLISKKESGQD